MKKAKTIARLERIEGEQADLFTNGTLDLESTDCQCCGDPLGEGEKLDKHGLCPRCARVWKRKSL